MLEIAAGGIIRTFMPMSPLERFFLDETTFNFLGGIV